MKRIAIAFLALAAIVFATVSCKDKFSTNGESTAISLILTFPIEDDDDIGTEIATVFGKFADHYEYNDDVDEAGFYYGTDPKLEDGSVVKKHMEDWWGEGEDTSKWKGFKANIYPLTANTVYYYRAYLIRNGQEELGAIMSFRTKPYSVTEVVVTPTTATIKLAAADKTVQLSATAYPEAASDRRITWASGNSSVAEVNENGLVTGKAEGVVYIYASSVQNPSVNDKCKVTVLPAPPEGAVDMGLPSGNYWYRYDLTATSEGTSGKFFSWAETSYKNPPFDSDHYPMGDAWDNFTKYNGHDHYSYIRPEDDAARVLLGGKWSVPKEAEWNELVSNCNITKTTGGFTLMAKNKGQDGVTHSLFFPYNGYYNGSDKKYDLDGEDYGSEQCFYWGNEVRYYTSGSEEYYKYGLCRRFYYDSGTAYSKNCNMVRWFGARIRPVYRVSD